MAQHCELFFLSNKNDSLHILFSVTLRYKKNKLIKI